MFGKNCTSKPQDIFNLDQNGFHFKFKVAEDPAVLRKVAEKQKLNLLI